MGRDGLSFYLSGTSSDPQVSREMKSLGSDYSVILGLGYLKRHNPGSPRGLASVNR